MRKHIDVIIYLVVGSEFTEITSQETLLYGSQVIATVLIQLQHMDM